jgi:uncharacterized ubiquitin-like protein YukD
MGEVICVLHFQNKKWDLVLPDNIPVRLLIDSLIKALNLPTDGISSYELSLIEDGKTVRIPSSQTLQQASILNGYDLSLLPSMVNLKNMGYLVAKDGSEFPLRDNTIIGRYTIEKYVDIDLSPLDTNKVVSRNHAIISRITNNYFIKDAGSLNGTFVNGVQIEKGHSITLRHRDEVCFGPIDQGVKLQFRVK